MSDEWTAACSEFFTEESLTESEIDAILSALADEVARHLLGCLIRNHPTSTPASTAVDHVADAVNAPPDKIRIDLHHRHWPRLEEIGLVEYDPLTGQLSYTGGESTKAVLKTVATLSGQSYFPPTDD